MTDKLRLWFIVESEYPTTIDIHKIYDRISDHLHYNHTTKLGLIFNPTQYQHFLNHIMKMFNLKKTDDNCYVADEFMGFEIKVLRDKINDN